MFDLLNKKSICLTLVNLFAVLIVSAILTACTTAPEVPQTTVEQPASKNQGASENISEKTELPEKVASAVLQDASKRTGKSSDELKITFVEARTWSDGCLGLAEPGVLCTQALVPGWQVQVSDNSEALVYHTNKSGTVVKLNTETKVNS
ncbi:MAG: hypothetical protein IGS39_11220 [Calothrix sp. C42_A2020_038]|nr:hypothetical protein [Calothrix sp. C42_A2020_038]